MSDPGLIYAHQPVDLGVWAVAQTDLLAQMKRELRAEADRRGFVLVSEPTALLVDPSDTTSTRPVPVTGEELDELTDGHGRVLVRVQARAVEAGR
jgi:hypothetical protein